jgi:very-short-patch-repair endonuclease
MISRRRKLRRNLTPAEATLWKRIRHAKLSGRKFRRQHSVGHYIVDFFCVEERLAVELDGEVHRNEQAEAYDYKRKLFLNEAGIKVIRFENFLVFEDLEYCS